MTRQTVVEPGRSAVAALLLLATPRAGEACASCISSAFGDQTYNWAYLGLILTPFVVGSLIAGALTWYWRSARRSASRDRSGDLVIREERT